MATVTSVPGTLDITPDPLQKQSKVQIRRNNKKGRIEIVTSTDSGNNYKTLLPEVTSKVQSGSIPVVQESGDVEWSVLAAKASTLTGVVPYVNGGTGQSSYAAGDILYANQQGVLSKLPVGSTDQLLTVSNALPAWQDIKLSDAVLSTVINFKGDVRAASTASISNFSVFPSEIDTVTLAHGDRILLKNQTTLSQNGIYSVSIPAASHSLTSVEVNEPGALNSFTTGQSFTLSGGSPVTAGVVSIDSLKVISATLSAKGAGLLFSGTSSTIDLTLTGGTSSPSAVFRVTSTEITDYAITAGSTGFDGLDITVKQDTFFNSISQRTLITDSRDAGKGGSNAYQIRRWTVGNSQGRISLLGWVYSPRAVASAANSAATIVSFSNLTGVHKYAPKFRYVVSLDYSSPPVYFYEGVDGSTSAPATSLPQVGDILTRGSARLSYSDTVTSSELAILAQESVYIITAVSGNPVTPTITTYPSLDFNGPVLVYERQTSDSNLRSFIEGDQVTFGSSNTKYTITSVTTTARSFSNQSGLTAYKIGTLSGSITIDPPLASAVSANAVIKFAGKSIGTNASSTFPRSTSFPAPNAYPLEVTIENFLPFVSNPNSLLRQQATTNIVWYTDLLSINTYSSRYQPYYGHSSDFVKLTPLMGISAGSFIEKGKYTSTKPTKLDHSSTVSFNAIQWGVNTVSVSNAGFYPNASTKSFTVSGQTVTFKNADYKINSPSISRTSDFNTWSKVRGAAVYVSEGSANLGSVWMARVSGGAGVIDTTSIPWTLISLPAPAESVASATTGSGSVVLSNGALLTNPVININVIDSTSNSFSAAGGATQDSITYQIKFPDSINDTLVGRNTYDILANKTLVNPNIPLIETGSYVGSSIVTLPQQTTTLVGTDTTDTLTNKTIESSILTGDTTLSSTSTFTPAAGATLDLSAANVILPSSTLSGFGYKAPVRAATTASIALSGTQTIDDVALVAGDRVLVKNQSPASGNGIYIVNASAWTRSADLNVWSEASAAVVVVQEGTLNQDTVWLSTANATGTIGTDSMPWGMIGVDQIGSGLTTQVLVGGGDNIKPVWTTATGTGAPVRAGSPTFTGTVGGLTKSMVGLSDVDNTTDLGKPVSTATQTALDLKANLASPTFTGTVTIPSGASISGFAPLASPIFTGAPSLPTGTTAVTQAVGNNTTAVATTAFVASVTTLSSLTSVGTLTSLSVNNPITGSVTGSAATVTGAGQPSITSVGTLTSLAVNGAITINGNSVITATQGNTSSFPGSITLSGGANTSANGGSINTSGFNNSSGGRSGGSINTSATTGSNGGSINTSGNISGAGGSIDTSNNGGFINTTGNGASLRGGFIITSGNNDGYTLPTTGTGGGYIYTAGNGGGNGGNINTSGSNFSSTARAGGFINTSAGSNGVGGSINTTNNGGLIETRGNNANAGGYIKTSGWNNGGSGSNGGFIDTSANSIYRGGFIATSGNITSIPTATGNGGGYIFTAGNNGGNGGNINTSGSNNNITARTGGDINTSATGGNNGGSINTSGNSGGVGGSISTSGGGGSITTNGSTGNIELGVAASRTTLIGSGTTCSITLPSTNNSVIMCNKDTAINLALVSSFF